MQVTDASTLVRQAGVTDDVPLHVLAGNVVPLAKGHHMTTVDVQNSSLVLVVAVPKDNVVAPAVRLRAAPHSRASCLWASPAVQSDARPVVVGALCEGAEHGGTHGRFLCTQEVGLR